MPPAGRLAHSGGSINSSLSPRLSASMVRGTQCCLQEAKTEQEGKVLLVFLLELVNSEASEGQGSRVGIQTRSARGTPGSQQAVPLANAEAGIAS